MKMDMHVKCGDGVGVNLVLADLLQPGYALNNADWIWCQAILLICLCETAVHDDCVVISHVY